MSFGINHTSIPETRNTPVFPSHNPLFNQESSINLETKKRTVLSLMLVASAYSVYKDDLIRNPETSKKHEYTEWNGYLFWIKQLACNLTYQTVLKFVKRTRLMYAGEMPLQKLTGDHHAIVESQPRNL